MKLTTLMGLALIFGAITTDAYSATDACAFPVVFAGAMSQFNQNPGPICEAACSKTPVGLRTGVWNGDINRNNSNCPHSISCGCN